MQICAVGAIMSTSALASLMFCVFVFVEPRPFLVLVICPFAVAVAVGKCFVIICRVRPGKVVSSLGWFVSTRKIEKNRGGEPVDWW